jgi:hypothetical protein
MLKNIFLPKVRKVFESAKQNIQRQKDRFSDSVRIAIARLNKQIFETVADTHQQVLKLTRKEGGTLMLGVKLPPNPNFHGREKS